MYLVEQMFVDKDLQKGWQPYYIYNIMVKEKVVGKLTFRMGSNQQQYIDGHVGYTIEPMYRGHHYAYQAMGLLKDIAREKGFAELILTCDPCNIASKKTILKLSAKYIETKTIPSDMKKYFTKEEVEKEIYLLSL